MIANMNKSVLLSGKPFIGAPASAHRARPAGRVFGKDPFTSDPSTTASSEDVVGCELLFLSLPCKSPILSAACGPMPGPELQEPTGAGQQTSELAFAKHMLFSSWACQWDDLEHGI